MTAAASDFLRGFFFENARHTNAHFVCFRLEHLAAGFVVNNFQIDAGLFYVKVAPIGKLLAKVTLSMLHRVGAGQRKCCFFPLRDLHSEFRECVRENRGGILFDLKS